VLVGCAELTTASVNFISSNNHIVHTLRTRLNGVAMHRAEALADCAELLTASVCSASSNDYCTTCIPKGCHQLAFLYRCLY
jgi:hypothetical protein